jgi:hypothetical protein
MWKRDQKDYRPMGIQCRAKDPNSCRVHGTSGRYEKLQGIADRAALAGNTSLYMDVREQMDALNDDLSHEAIEAAAASRWTNGRWEKISEGAREAARTQAHLLLEAAAPYLKNRSELHKAVTAYARKSWELREEGGLFDHATTEVRNTYLRNARNAIEAASPHIGDAPTNLDDHLKNSLGLNIVYRGKMRAILKSEDNEMPRLKELFKEITRRQADEGIRIMTPNFEKSFIDLYNQNVKPEDQLK